jgi:hypothetical protein
VRWSGGTAEGDADARPRAMRVGNCFLEDVVRTGAIAGAATTAIVAACGAAEDGEAIAPVNAVSHIAWGDEAARQTAPSVKFTLTGLVLNAAAVTSWAVIYHALFGGRKITPVAAATGAVATSALAYVTDYHVVPERLTPGFEKRLSNRSLALTYGVLAAGFMVGGLLARRDRKRGVGR